MKFKGTIVITDPCYIMNKDNNCEMPEEYRKLRPKQEDFFSFYPGLPHQYPDARPKTEEEITDSDRELIKTRERMISHLQSKGWNGKKLEPYIPMYSATYEKEYEDLLEADYNWRYPYMSDWERCGCGEDMSVLGFKNYLTSQTYYGDWGCTTFEKESKKILGQFCADAGMVGVFLLEEILKYNPKFDLHLFPNHAATVLKNFDGEVVFEKESEIVEYNGRKYEDIELHVVGHGNINFITSQTSL